MAKKSADEMVGLSRIVLQRLVTNMFRTLKHYHLGELRERESARVMGMETELGTRNLYSQQNVLHSLCFTVYL